MNPVKGINPHGLEDRTLIFHVIENNEETITQTTKNRLYCWAQIPKDLRDTYGIEWAIERPSTMEQFRTLPKYVSKKMEELPRHPLARFNLKLDSKQTLFGEEMWLIEYTGNIKDKNAVAQYVANQLNVSIESILNLTIEESAEYGQPYWATEENKCVQFMVMGNQDFYFMKQYDTRLPEYATVFVIDTSGSMRPQDYNNAVTNGISNIIYDYNCFDSAHSKIIAYSGTYVSNIKSNGYILGTEDYTGSLLDNYETLHEYVNKFIRNIPKKNSSESMMSCLYQTIASIQDIWLKEDNDNGFQIKPDMTLKAITFVLITDEGIFKSDTLNDWTKVKNQSPWFNKWMNEATNKFPTSLSNGKLDFAKNINKAFQQMSHFYGVNINWGIIHRGYNPISANNSDYEAIKSDVYSIAGDVKADEETVDVDWKLNETDTENPHKRMVCVIFDTDGKGTPTNEILDYGKQYDNAKVMDGLHKENANRYFLFRYPNETITTPTIRNAIGKWVSNDGKGNTKLGMNSQYTIPELDKPDPIWSNYGQIRFKFKNIIEKTIKFNLYPKFDTRQDDEYRFCGRSLEVQVDGQTVITHIDYNKTTLKEGTNEIIHTDYIIKVEHSFKFGDGCELSWNQPLFPGWITNGWKTYSQEIALPYEGPAILNEGGDITIPGYDGTIFPVIYYSFIPSYVFPKQDKITVSIKGGQIIQNDQIKQSLEFSTDSNAGWNLNTPITHEFKIRY